MSEQARQEIRSLMIGVTGGRVILPNATVAEVITFASAEPVPEAPPWVLGRIGWRGWRLPLFSFAMLAGLAREEGYINAKVAVLKALGGRPRFSYMAMLTQGFPRLVTITPDVIVPEFREGELPPGVLMRVMVRDDPAFIPDLAAIENGLVEVLKIAA
ncbi:MAG: chemotaxis protein CheW [Lysobacterales bacterium]|jgi:chemosensory pili system protein ChpC|nr:MAG: chemotaxis protein CheW [Xanthomonadales bacterium]